MFCFIKQNWYSRGCRWIWRNEERLKQKKFRSNFSHVRTQTGHRKSSNKLFIKEQGLLFFNKVKTEASLVRSHANHPIWFWVLAQKVLDYTATFKANQKATYTAQNLNLGRDLMWSDHFTAKIRQNHLKQYRPTYQRISNKQ